MTTLSRILTTLFFVVTTFLFLFFYEGDILYVVQNMLAEGKTHYDDTIGAILITLVMYLIHLFIVAVTGLRTVGFGLTFFPSILLLSLLVLLRPETNVRLSYIVVASLLTLLFLFGVWFCRQMSSIPTKDTEKFKFLKSLWVDLTLIIIPIILLWGLTDASDVYHHRVRSERLILAGRAADVIDVGRNTREIDKSLTTLRIYSMAVSGQLGDSLFTIPINIKGEDVLPVGSDVHFLLLHRDSLLRSLGVDPRIGNTTKERLKYALRRDDTRQVAADLLLSSLLIDGKVDEFAIELPKYYAINDSLPRYFREAVSEMINVE
ncbi:MAG: hypothetical protein IJL45_05720 [Prevotella sp.]|nr:hypothetical protein [Prevotella sp.]